MLNWMGMLPVLPGSTCFVHSPAVVQPHCGCTLLMTSNASPVFVNTEVYLTGSPDLHAAKIVHRRRKLDLRSDSVRSRRRGGRRSRGLARSDNQGADAHNEDQHKRISHNSIHIS